jgi:uncharacterized membrane protein YesL
VSAAAPVTRRRLFTVSHETFESMFGLVYTGLMVNVALVLANLPLAFFVFAVPDPLSSWPFFLLLSLTLAPSVAGAFGCFRAMKDDGPPRPLLAFWRSYRRNVLRSFVVGTAAGAVVAIVLLDLAVLGSNPFAPLIAPTFFVLGLSALAVTIVALAAFALYPQASAWPIVKASVYLAIKRWYFSVMALVLVGLIAAAVLLQPILGAFLAPSLLLFAVWSNAHFSFVRLVEAAR